MHEDTDAPDEGEAEDGYLDIVNRLRDLADFYAKSDTPEEAERRFQAFLDAEANRLRPPWSDRPGAGQRRARLRVCRQPSYVQRSPETDW